MICKKHIIMFTIMLCCFKKFIGSDNFFILILNKEQQVEKIQELGANGNKEILNALFDGLNQYINVANIQCNIDKGYSSSESDTEYTTKIKGLNSAIRDSKKKLRSEKRKLVKDTKKFNDIMCLFFSVQASQNLINNENRLSEYKNLIIGKNEILSNITYENFCKLFSDAICEIANSAEQTILLGNLGLYQSRLLDIINKELIKAQEESQSRKEEGMIPKEEAVKKTKECVTQKEKEMEEEYGNKIFKYKICIFVLIIVAVGLHILKP